jgi:hypothetical protein
VAKPATPAPADCAKEILKIVFQDCIVPPGGFVKMYYFAPEKSDKVIANSFDVRYSESGFRRERQRRKPAVSNCQKLLREAESAAQKGQQPFCTLRALVPSTDVQIPDATSMPGGNCQNCH